MADKYIAHKDCGIHATYERNPCPHCERERLSCENGAFRDLLARVVCTACDHGISLKRDFEEAGVELGSLTLKPSD